MVQLHVDQLLLGDELLVNADKLADNKLELDGNLELGPHDLVVHVQVDELVLG